MTPGPRRPAYLALAVWHLGEVARAESSWMRRWSGRSKPRTFRLASACASHRLGSRSSVTIPRRPAKLGKSLWRSAGARYPGLYGHWRAVFAWARAKIGGRDYGAGEFRRALTDYASKGNRAYLPFYRRQLAEIEAEGGDAEAPWP